MIRFPRVATLLVLVAACSVSQDQEVALGRQDAAEINAQLPIVTDPEISDYIQTLGKSIASKTSRADLDWRFYVVNTKQVNAFALPGGFIYVNRGLIESADRLDELTGTMGHEIGHVIERHSVKQMQSAQKANVGIAVVCTLTSICHSGLAQAAVQVGGTALFAKYSRVDEMQADSEGVVNVTRAGYDPQGIPDLFQVLLKEREYQPNNRRWLFRYASPRGSADQQGECPDCPAAVGQVTPVDRGHTGVPDIQAPRNSAPTAATAQAVERPATIVSSDWSRGRGVALLLRHATPRRRMPTS